MAGAPHQQPNNPYAGPPRQPLGGNYPRGPYQGPPQQPLGGNYPRGAYQGPPQYAPQVGAAPYGHAQANMGVTPGLVTAGFVLALIPCTSFIGLVLSAVGMGEAKRRQAGTGLALAGIIIGVCWQVLGTIFWIAVEVMEASSSSTTYY